VEGILAPLTRDHLVTQDGELRLTAKGEEALAKLWFTMESAESKILTGFTEDEASILKKQLHRIQENCVQVMGGESHVKQQQRSGLDLEADAFD
jgi:hypothetical protein